MSSTSSERLFDETWYLATYADLRPLLGPGSQLTALSHYTALGASQGRSPNAHFDERFYRARYPDVDEAIRSAGFLCGFDHYVRHGQRERRRPRPPSVKCAVDLTGLPRHRSPLSHAWRLAEIILDALESMVSWDSIVLTSRVNQQTLTGLGFKELSFLDPEQCAEGVEARLSREQVTVFVAPLGTSEFRQPHWRTLAIVTEEVMRAIDRPHDAAGPPSPAIIGAHIASADLVLCPSQTCRRDLARQLSLEEDCISVLPTPPVPGVAPDDDAALARLGLTPGAYVLAPVLSMNDRQRQAVVAGFEAFASRHASTHWKLACPMSGPADRRAARDELARLGLHAVVPADLTTTADYRRLIGSAFAAVEPSRYPDGSLLAVDAASLRVPVLWAHDHPEAGEDVRALAGIDCESAASVTAGLDRIAAGRDAFLRSVAGPGGAAGRTGDQNEIRQQLRSALEKVRAAERPRHPLHDAIYGVNGNCEVERLMHVQLAAGGKRRLRLAFASPSDFPTPQIAFEVMVGDRRADSGRFARGRPLQLSIQLEEGEELVTLAFWGLEDGGKTVSPGNSWPRLRLRLATLDLAPRDLLMPASGSPAPSAAAFDPGSGQRAVDAINDLVELYAPLSDRIAEAVDAAHARLPALRLTVPPAPMVSRARAPRILHIVRRQTFASGLAFHGSNKDQGGRTEYFNARGFSVDARIGLGPEAGITLSDLRNDQYADYQAILIESVASVTLMEALRERFPKALMLIRSHNAEILHRIDTEFAKARMEGGSLLRGLMSSQLHNRIRTVLQYYRFERDCARLCDYVLSISDWESAHYWPKLVARSKILTVPYFLPSGLYDATQVPQHRRRRCVCLTSASPGPIIVDAVRRFAGLVRQAGPALQGWELVTTGTVSHPIIPECPQISALGMVDDPIAEMRGSSAMALMSPYGYGVKTKILDAIQAGCFTVLPASLMRRQPKVMQQYCLAADPGSPRSFVDALERSTGPWPGGNPNELLREQAFSALDGLMGITAGQRP